MEKIINMISEIYEKTIFYFEKDRMCESYTEYSILRECINSGWIHTNYEEFVDMWERVKMNENIYAYSESVTRMTNDNDDDKYDTNNYDILQGHSGVENSSYDSFADDQLFQMRRVMHLPDDNMSISELASDLMHDDIMNEYMNE